jgi:uncharacterized FAD-dependent dehydrogenase
MKKWNDIQVGLDEELEDQLQWLAPGYGSFRILKKSVDARQRHNPHFIYSVEVYDKGETPPDRQFQFEKSKYQGPKPLIIGSGPAGLFAALRLVERGIPCVLFERGSECVARMKGINRFWRYGELDPQNNVCFGEGGAGLYSDGKLITRIKSPHIQYVMNRMVQFGAPEEIEYLANPHVGSDRIRRVIPKMREFLIQNGCEIHFDTQVTEIRTSPKVGGTESGPLQQISGVRTARGEIYHSDKVILATGHSAEDVFHHLDEIGVAIEGKSFAVGLRVEHPQKVINQIQFREAAEHPKLGAANYKLAHHDKTQDIGVYSFCMCPGGYVLSSGTSASGIVCNGMSNYKRNSPFANAAIVFTVDHNRSFGAGPSNKWGGLRFRQGLEEQALQMVKSAGGSKEIPVQKLTDFLKRRSGAALPSSSPSHVLAAPLHELFTRDFYSHFVKGIEKFGQDMKGFISDEAQLHAVESRTSCPIRVTRDTESLQSISHEGLYPCGEGAGYAGGITSAACDGIKIADKIAGF